MAITLSVSLKGQAQSSVIHSVVFNSSQPLALLGQSPCPISNSQSINYHDNLRLISYICETQFVIFTAKRKGLAKKKERKERADIVQIEIPRIALHQRFLPPSYVEHNLKAQTIKGTRTARAKKISIWQHTTLEIRLHAFSLRRM